MCPSLLNEENRSNWKVRMKFFVQAFDYGAWKLISKGPLEVIHMLLCAMGKEVFNKVSSCGSVKEIWDKLEEIYEDKKEEKEIKKTCEKESSSSGKQIKYEQ
ncbi:hypothetical protein Gogos_015361 [Gossypium gossypioides]|uniref:Uncharacterized protein n=1 Tax=Gossypium gossypioides TaxID=34282 RepID=A0A7J9C1G2_GOSGO|nr:hypothetical protein [Gossypium gossypioides]